MRQRLARDTGAICEKNNDDSLSERHNGSSGAQVAVSGVSGAIYKGYETRAEAQAAYDRCVARAAIAYLPDDYSRLLARARDSGKDFDR